MFFINFTQNSIIMDRATLDRLVAKGFEFDQRYYELADMQTKYDSENYTNNYKKEYLIFGYWSSDREGEKIVTKSNLGNIVYFNIRTINVKDKTKIKFQLFDEDIISDDNKFPKSSKNKTVSEKKIIKTIVINNSTATIELKLEDSWESMIHDDFDNGIFSEKIELYWTASFENYNQKILNILDVYYSKKHLFLKPAYLNYSLPEMLTEQGENIIFSIGDFANEELKKQLVEIAGENLDNYRYFLGTRILKSGKVATNIEEVFQRKKSIYTYDLHTNSGKEVKLMQASNFGFKNKYVNNGKLVTTKGISQIDYFTNVGLKNNILKAGKELTQIWDIFDLAKVFFSDDYTDFPTGYLGDPVSFAFALLNEAVIKPTVQSIKNDWNQGLDEDFETIYKRKGLEACKAFVDNKKIKTGFDYVDIFSPTLQKLLKNEFLNYNEMKNYNDKIRESGTIKSAKQGVLHTAFYKAEKNKYGLNDDIFINCIFVNNQILKE